MDTDFLYMYLFNPHISHVLCAWALLNIHLVIVRKIPTNVLVHAN